MSEHGSIEDVLDQELAGTVAKPERWQVENLDDASWASRQALGALRRIDTVKEWEKREIARVKAAAAAQREGYERTLARMKEALGDYVKRMREAGETNLKSLELPGGTIIVRSSTHIEWMDDPAVLEWARERDAVRIKEELDKLTAKKRVKAEPDGSVVDVETGEILPFARAEFREDVPAFTPAKGGA